MSKRSGGRENLEYATHFNIMSSEGQPHTHEPIPLSPSLSTTSSQQTPLKEEEFDDTAWSIYSNTFFLSGGIFYLLATSWDYSIFHLNRNISIDDALNTPQRVFYELLWFMGPMVYLLNSIIDVRWALKVRERDGRRRELEKLLVGKSRKSDSSSKQVGEQTDPSEGDGKEMSALQIEESTPKRNRRLRKLIYPTKKILHRMRKHMGHRRDLMAAVTFGIAAFLSVTGAICYLISTQGEFSFVIHSARSDVEINQGTLEAWAAHLERGSIHMYLVSAVFALWRNPCKSGGGGERENIVDCGRGNGSWIQMYIMLPISRPFNDVESMETVGDVFFGLASVVDVFLEDSTLDDNVLWWPIVSALLWTFDALFYLRGDFVTLFLRKEVLTSGDSDEEVQLSTSFVGLDGDEEADGARDQQQVWEYPADGNDANNLALS
jgi:hypothetical protein